VLASIIAKAGQDGLGRIVEEYMNRFPGTSKRQTELKVQEIAIKEKRDNEAYKKWNIRPSFEFYLRGELAWDQAGYVAPVARPVPKPKVKRIPKEQKPKDPTVKPAKQPRMTKKKLLQQQLEQAAAAAAVAGARAAAALNAKEAAAAASATSEVAGLTASADIGAAGVLDPGLDPVLTDGSMEQNENNDMDVDENLS
jgi:outer membrane biosynthesis protein TonB